MKISKIRIMSVCEGACVWDEDNYNISLMYMFSNHPQYDEILKLESEMKTWTSEWDAFLYDGHILSWEEFNNKGMELTRKLSKLLRGSNIEVVYVRPNGDPDRKNLHEEKF